MVALGWFGFALAADETKKASKPKPAAAKAATTPKTPAPAPADDGPMVITNDVLEKMFGPSDVKPPRPETAAEGDARPTEGSKGEGEKPLDPVQAMEEEKKTAAERQAKIAAAEKAVADAEENLKQLESRLLATKNPYLPRPPMTPEEAKEVEGMDNAQRVDLNQKQIEDARAAVEKRKAELQQARAGS
jgi:hypothetical protein